MGQGNTEYLNGWILKSNSTEEMEDGRIRKLCKFSAKGVRLEHPNLVEFITPPDKEIPSASRFMVLQQSKPVLQNRLEFDGCDFGESDNGPLGFDGSGHFENCTFQGGNCFFHDLADLKNVKVGHHARIGSAAKISNAILGDNVLIEEWLELHGPDSENPIIIPDDTLILSQEDADKFLGSKQRENERGDEWGLDGDSGFGR